MGEKGLVLTATDDELTVSMTRTEACAKCRACIAGFAKNEMVLKTKNHCDAKVNDWVNIELDVSYSITATLILYGVPLCFMVFGFVLGYYLPNLINIPAQQELVSFACGIVFMCLSFLVIKRNDKYLDKEAYTPIATAIIEA